MNEREENFDNLTTAEFEQMATNALSPDFHELAEEDFFTALAAIEEEPAETLELTATEKLSQ